MSDWERIALGDVVLRRLLPQDAAGVLSVHGDPRVYSLDPHEIQQDLADAQRFIEPMLEHWRKFGFGYWTVLVPEAWWREGERSGTPEGEGLVQAGLGGLRTIDLAGEQGLNVYFRLAPTVHGRGIAGRIIAACKAIAPLACPGRDLWIRTRPANAAVLKVAEREGFSPPQPDPAETNMVLMRLSVPAEAP